MRFQNWDQSITYLRRCSNLFGSTCMRLHPIYNTGTKAIFMAFLRTYKMQLYYCVVSFTPKNTRNKIPPQNTSDQTLWCLRKNLFSFGLQRTVVEQVKFSRFFAKEAFIGLSAGRIKTDAVNKFLLHSTSKL